MKETSRAERHGEPWPAYHLTVLPDEGVGCPYDANGCIWWKGRYHLMYIYQDPSLPKGGHCWGHWSSADLVSWTCHPPALVPAPGDPDTGIFSGNAFVSAEGVPMLCWYGIDAGVCVATAQDDELIRWKKHPRNPVIPIPREGDPGHGRYSVWDPYLWLEGGTYFCLLGGNKLPDGKDTLYLCRSSDLVSWTPVHPFYEHPDPGWTEEGEDCSCPDFFRLGDRHVLMCISHKVGARCYVGRFDRAAEKFLPERHVRMNWRGGMFFAPESMEDPQGRRLFWAWVTDPRLGPSQRRTGSGVQSLPRVLSLDRDGAVRIEPAEELDRLRRSHRRIGRLELHPGEDAVLPGTSGRCLELAVEFDVGRAQEIGLKVFCSPDGAEETGIRYDTSRKTLAVEMSRSTLRNDVSWCQPPFAAGGWKDASENPHPFTAVEAPLELARGERLSLRVFLDGPMLEVFANGRQCITQQVFPSRDDALLVRACARGGSATVLSADTWDMAGLELVDRRRGTR